MNAHCTFLSTLRTHLQAHFKNSFGLRWSAYCASLVCTLVLAITACSQSQAPQPTNDGHASVSESEMKVQALALGTQHLKIVDSAGRAIVGAHVLVGPAIDNPFIGNWFTTDASGEVPVMQNWADNEPVTIEANGFVRATYFDQAPGAKTFTLRRAPSAAEIELKGKTTGFTGVVDGDGIGDAGLVYTAIPRSQASALQFTQLVSTTTDELAVLDRKLDMPSNLTFPKQHESYIIFDIDLDKPQYRIQLPFSSTWQVVATHITFPFATTVDALKDGKQITDVAENFTITEASISSTAVSGSNSRDADLNVARLTFEKSVPFTAPMFDSKYKMLALSMAENDGLYYMADLKPMTAGQALTLNAPAGGGLGTKGVIVSVLKPNDNSAINYGAASEQISSVTIAANQSQSFDFLEICKAPNVAGSQVSMTPPEAPVSVEPSLTYAVLDRVERIEKGQLILEKKTPQWELYAKGWAQKFDLPQLPTELKAKNQRWEVMFGANFKGQADVELGPAALGKISHVSRSAIDL